MRFYRKFLILTLFSAAGGSQNAKSEKHSSRSDFVSSTSAELGSLDWLEAYAKEYFNDSTTLMLVVERMKVLLLLSAMFPSIGGMVINELLRARRAIPLIKSVAPSELQFGIDNRYERVHDLWLFAKIFSKKDLSTENKRRALEYITESERSLSWGRDYSWMRVFNSDPVHLNLFEFERDVSLMKELEIMGYLSGDRGLTGTVQAFYNVSQKENADASVIGFYREKLADLTEIVIGGSFWNDKWVNSGTDPETEEILKSFDVFG